jgi:hypothetical protein
MEDNIKTDFTEIGCKDVNCFIYLKTCFSGDVRCVSGVLLSNTVASQCTNVVTGLPYAAEDARVIYSHPTHQHSIPLYEKPTDLRPPAYVDIYPGHNISNLIINKHGWQMLPEHRMKSNAA